MTIPIVLDTNVLVSRILSPSGTPARLFQLVESGSVQLLVSDDILEEYRQVLRYPRLHARHGMSPESIDELVDGLARIAVQVAPEPLSGPVSPDPDDDKFVACAVTGSAHYIVSGDADLLRVQEFRGIRVLTPTAFVLLMGLDSGI